MLQVVKVKELDVCESQIHKYCPNITSSTLKTFISFPFLIINAVKNVYKVAAKRKKSCNRIIYDGNGANTDGVNQT